MTDRRDESQPPSPSPIVVLGGTGRVGRAVTAELADRDVPVIAVSRTSPRDHRLPGVEYRSGDARSVPAALADVRAAAVVVAVTPFTAPPATFDGFDADYYRRIVDGLVSAVPAATPVVLVGLTAIAALTDGTRFGDHAEHFPPRLRPFADAHRRGADALAASGLRGTVLIPAAGLGTATDPASASAVAPSVLPTPVHIEDALASLDHRGLAVAAADRLLDPTPDDDVELLVRGRR